MYPNAFGTCARFSSILADHRVLRPKNTVTPNCLQRFNDIILFGRNATTYLLLIDKPA